jgi:hypothetical protein
LNVLTEIVRKPIGPVKGRRTVVEIDGVLYLRLTPEEPEPEPVPEEKPEEQKPAEVAEEAAEKKEEAKPAPKGQQQQQKKGGKGKSAQTKKGKQEASLFSVPVFEELEYDIGPISKNDVSKDEGKKKVNEVKTAVYEEEVDESGVPVWFKQLERDIDDIKNPVPKRKPKKSLYFFLFGMEGEGRERGWMVWVVGRERGWSGKIG